MCNLVSLSNNVGEKGKKASSIFFNILEHKTFQQNIAYRSQKFLWNVPYI